MSIPTSRTLLAAIILMAILLLPITCLAFPRNSTKVVIPDKDFNLEISKNDILVRSLSSNEIVFSTKEQAKKNFQSYVRRAEGGFRYQESFKILSLVGPFLSVKYQICYEENNGDACPSWMTQYISVDLRRPIVLAKFSAEENTNAPFTQEKPLQLTDLFSKKVVLKALLADKIISSTLGMENVHIKNIEELVLKLNGQMLPEGNCGFYDHTLLNAFAFHHLAGDKVAVRISIGGGTGPCRGYFSELGILLPIPDLWHSELVLAEQGTEGFLQGGPQMKALKAVTYQFEYKK